MDRCKMLEWVQALCFVVVDMQLYLDTHPCDQEALAYYREAVENYEKAKMEFEEAFGPLTAMAFIVVAPFLRINGFVYSIEPSDGSDPSKV